MKTEKYSIMSFFAGCGGLDLGFEGGFSFLEEDFRRLPFEVANAYDIDEKAIATYNRNFKGDRGKVIDLAVTPAEDIASAEILIGGFPCQDFSSCGPKLGLSSKRGQLFQVLTDYMETHKPKVVVAENVPNLARMGGGVVLKTILKSFEDAGYSFEVWNLYAPDFGVPQRRNRLFFVGVRDDLFENFGAPRCPVGIFADHHRSIKWAIDDLAPKSMNSVPNQDQYFKASKAKKGNGQGDETNKADQPSYTIRANAKSRVQFHYKLPRRLTVRECARLQTFPDTFVFEHSATANVMQIGNAVPPILAHAVALSISEYLKVVAAFQERVVA